MAVLAPPDDAALASIIAGRYGVQMNVGTRAAPAWAWVNGIQSFEPKFEVKTEDDTTITSDGWASEAPVGNAWTADISGLVKVDNSGPTPIPDPGLSEFLRRARQADETAVGQFRYWRTDDIAEAFEIDAVIKVGLTGGKSGELQKWSGSLVGRGKPREIVKPTENAVYTITLGGGVTAFTLTVDGQTTASISNSGPAAASAVQSALVALSTVGAGNVTVTGSAGGPFTATFTGAVSTVTGAGTGGTVTVAAV